MGVGIGEAGCIPSSHSLISDLFPPRRRTLAISIYQTGSVAGQAGGLFLIGVLAQHFGWRAALQIVGVAGLPLALLAFLTMREPPRPVATAEAKESAWRAFAALARRRTFVNLALAYGLSTFCTSGLQQWTPTFLIRSFGLNMAQVGAWAGLSVALGGILGTLSGGAVATWLTARHPRLEPWIPAASYALAWPFYTLLYLAPTVWAALLLKAVAGYFAAMGAAVALAAVQSLTEPHRRATAVSIVLFLSYLLGTGLGPYLIGFVSDTLAPTLGKESLRYALAFTCILLAWSTFHYALSARRQPSDIAR
jgi:MFS family permease